VFSGACNGLFRSISLGRDAGGRNFRACCPNGTERGSATRSSPESERAQEIPWGFGLLNVLQLTEPRSAVAEIDLGNTPWTLRRNAVFMRQRARMIEGPAG
jgi:hypothetical protein